MKLDSNLNFTGPLMLYLQTGAVLKVVFLTQGVYLKKNWQGGSAYFLGLKCLIFLFFWVWKNLSYFLDLKIFHLFFWGSNFDTIYFLGCPVRRMAQIAQRTYFFGFVIFMNLFFGSDFSWYLFFWVSQKMPGPSPPVIYMSEYTPWAF